MGSNPILGAMVYSLQGCMGSPFHRTLLTHMSMFDPSQSGVFLQGLISRRGQGAVLLACDTWA